MVENDFLELLVDFFLFTENNITLTLDSLLVKLGVLEDVGEDVDGLGDVGVKRLGVVDCVLALHQM